jgi:hypothetical protein
LLPKEQLRGDSRVRRIFSEEKRRKGLLDVSYKLLVQIVIEAIKRNNLSYKFVIKLLMHSLNKRSF